jgi:hypothetical protein
MRTFPLLRPRTPQTNVVDPATATLKPQNLPAPPSTTKFSASGAMALLKAGLFGVSTPQNQLSSQIGLAPGHGAGVYAYHEGDLFTPGTQNYVFDYPWELPMGTIWGHAFLRTPNTFDPLQPPQQYSYANVRLNGIGGLVAGQMALQPLESIGD